MTDVRYRVSFTQTCARRETSDFWVCPLHFTFEELQTIGQSKSKRSFFLLREDSFPSRTWANLPMFGQTRPCLAKHECNQTSEQSMSRKIAASNGLTISQAPNSKKEKKYNTLLCSKGRIPYLGYGGRGSSPRSSHGASQSCAGTLLSLSSMVQW